MNLRYTDRALSELSSAFEWYESQRRGLGFDFLDSIEVSIRNIISFPELYAISHSNFRKCVIRRFPFSIFYTIEINEIIIHAIFDNRQNPKRLI